MFSSLFSGILNTRFKYFSVEWSLSGIEFFIWNIYKCTEETWMVFFLLDHEKEEEWNDFSICMIKNQ